jgi:hypothetical protein
MRWSGFSFSGPVIARPDRQDGETEPANDNDIFQGKRPFKGFRMIRAIVRSAATGLSSAMYDFIDAKSAFAVSEYSISKAVHLPNLLFGENRVRVLVGMLQGGLDLGLFPC